MDISNLNQIDLRNVSFINVDLTVGPDYDAVVVFDVLDPGLQQRILMKANQFLQFTDRIRQKHTQIAATTKVNPL